MTVLKLEGLNEVKARLDAERLTGDPGRKMLTRAVAKAKAEIKSAAPKGTGKIAGSVQGKTRKSYAVVTIGATAPYRGHPPYRYWRRLNWDPRSRRKGWFTNALKRFRSATWPAEVAALKRDVEAMWRRG